MLPDADDRLPANHVVAGRYKIVRLLGEGGMGVVYEASHVELGSAVALKVLAPAFARDREMVGRFMREARAAAQIGHPGIVRVFDLGTDGRLIFLAMEKLEGEELQKRIQRAHPLPISFVCRMGADLCDAIAAAHERGIVHRDLKPQNIFLAREGREDDVVKVLDFGIAKLMEAGPGESQTQTGQVFGTPLYMAPEQLRDSKEVDPRTDVYAIGCVLFQALTGHPPFQSAAYPDLIYKICSEPPPPVSSGRPDSGPSLTRIIAKALSKDPKQRHASAAELRDDLLSLTAPTERAPTVVGMPGAPVGPSAASGHAPTERSGSAAAATPGGALLAESASELPAHSSTLKPLKTLRLPFLLAVTLGGLTAIGIWRATREEPPPPLGETPTSGGSGNSRGSASASGSSISVTPTVVPVASTIALPSAAVVASIAASAVGPRPTATRTTNSSKNTNKIPSAVPSNRAKPPPPLVPR